jgi:hypothetical protein
MEPHTNFKIAYHGAGRADGAGQACRGNSWRWELEMGQTASGPLFVQKINDGSFVPHNRQTGHRQVAFDFSKVNYGSGVFEALTGPPNAKKNLNDRSALTDVSRVEYSWLSNGEMVGMDGIVRVSKGPTTDKWEFVDLLHSEYSGRGVMCSTCTAREERPVHHGKSLCPTSAASAAPLPLRPTDVVQPNEARFEGCGEQLKRNKKSKPRGGVKTGSDNLTCDMLRDFLREHGLPTTGRRDKLLKRAKGVDGSSSSSGDGGGGALKASTDSDEEALEWEGDSAEESDGVTGEDESEDREGPSGAVFAVQSIDDRRTIRRQTQYLFTWVGEDKPTWETRNSYGDYDGKIDFVGGMSKELIQKRCDQLDEEARAARAAARAARKDSEQ